MKSIWRLRSWRGSRLAALALASVCWLVPGKAAPQEQPHEKAKPVPVESPKPVAQKPAAAPQPVIKVFSLQHASAPDLVSVLQQLLGNSRALRFGVDARSNSLVVSAPQEDIGRIESFISRLDVAPARIELRSEVLPLHFTRADNNLQQELQQAIQAGPGGMVSVDLTRNKVVVSGSEATLHTVRRLLEELERPAAPNPANSDMQVRIVWLASGTAPIQASKPPDDLKEVVAELAKLGVENPRLVSQAIVTAQLGKQFRVEGLAGRDQPYRLLISGTVLEGAPGETSKLQVSIQATQAARPGFGSSTNQGSRLDTEITAPLRHAVVLGMTPTETSTSVFVVQILPKN